MRPSAPPAASTSSREIPEAKSTQSKEYTVAECVAMLTENGAEEALKFGAWGELGGVDIDQMSFKALAAGNSLTHLMDGRRAHLWRHLAANRERYQKIVEAFFDRQVAARKSIKEQEDNAKAAARAAEEERLRLERQKKEEEKTALDQLFRQPGAR